MPSTNPREINPWKPSILKPHEFVSYGGVRHVLERLEVGAIENITVESELGCAVEVTLTFSPYPCIRLREPAP